MLPTLFLDTETVPDIALARKVLGDQQHDDAYVLADLAPPKHEGESYGFLKTMYHQVVVAFVGATDETGHLTAFKALEGDEPAKLRGFWSGLHAMLSKGPTRVVTFNGRRFDMPVMIERSLHHGVSPMVWMRNPDYNNRYKDWHLDLMDWLSNRGAGSSLSQHEIATLVGVPGKLGVDGGDVAGLIAQGDEATVTAYCGGDVATLIAIFCRLAVPAGWADADEIRTLEGDLRRTLSEGASTRPLWGEFVSAWGGAG